MPGKRVEKYAILNTVIFLAKEISSTQVTHGNAFME
jgi:hypothetical protein